jgi:hypothetical protein
MECAVPPLSVLHYYSCRMYSSSVTYDGNSFTEVSGLLRLCTKYQVDRLRMEILRGLSKSWPLTLSQWEERESRATDASGIYAPRHALPHPM